MCFLTSNSHWQGNTLGPQENESLNFIEKKKLFKAMIKLQHQYRLNYFVLNLKKILPKGILGKKKKKYNGSGMELPCYIINFLLYPDMLYRKFFPNCIIAKTEANANNVDI